MPLVPGLRERLEGGLRVADVGSGQGHAVNLLAHAFPASEFIGYDFSEAAIDVGRPEASDWGLANARFEVRDVADLAGTGAFGLITALDAIHDQAHPATVLEQVAAHLEDDGVFLMLDMRASSNLEENLGIPWVPFLYTVSTMHCMTVSLALEGDGLGTVWGVERDQTCWRRRASVTSGSSTSMRTSSTPTTLLGVDVLAHGVGHLTGGAHSSGAAHRPARIPRRSTATCVRGARRPERPASVLRVLRSVPRVSPVHRGALRTDP